MEKSACSADSDEVACLDPGDVGVGGEILTFPCRPPRSVYKTDPDLMMSPPHSLPVPGRNAILHAGAVGKSWFCDLSQPLCITWPGEPSSRRQESPEAGEIQAESA